MSMAEKSRKRDERGGSENGRLASPGADKREHAQTHESEHENASSTGDDDDSEDDDDEVKDAVAQGQQKRENGGDEDEDDDDDEDEDDAEPTLKYAKLTSKLSTIYRNGDSTSSSLVSGDKMIVGTHNGNVHIISIPTFQLLRSYHARPSSVTAISVSPYSPIFTSSTPTATSSKPPPNPQSTPTKDPSAVSSASPGNSPRRPLPAIPTNSIHIAVALMDGYVCISSLVDPKDVTLRNYARPVHAVALSPNYKTDRTYLSGGTSGNLILTVGGRIGVSEDANTSGAAAAASGWLSSIGISSGSGKDTTLHGGEGTITSIKWSLSGKYVVWNNEYGTRIMRSHLNHQNADSESIWKRLGHIPRPQRRIWEDMAGVWKARVEWIDEKSYEQTSVQTTSGPSAAEKALASLSPNNSVRATPSTPSKHKTLSTERLLVGWGDTVWIIHVNAEVINPNQSQIPRESVELGKVIRFPDDIVSGLTLYTPSILVVLIYRSEDDDVSSTLTSAGDGTSKKGIRKRHNGLPPDLRLVDLDSDDMQELEAESLIVSRHESLSASDYTLSRLLIPIAKETTPAQRGALGAIGGGIRDNATRLFSSSASVLSGSSSGEKTTSNSTAPLSIDPSTGLAAAPAEALPVLAKPGLKIFIQSPFDCLVAVKRDEKDRLSWLLARDMFKESWNLVNDHPEVIWTLPADSRPSTPQKSGQTLADFFDDEVASQSTSGAGRPYQLNLERDKQYIGNLWIQQLVHANHWSEAGAVAGKVLGDSPKWSDWIMEFAHAGKFDEITPHIPTKPLRPPLPTFVYEVVLGHYIIHDKQYLQSLLELWDPALYDVSSIINAIKDNLDSGSTDRQAVEAGVTSDGQRILLEILATLFIAENNPSEAIRCYTRIRNSDAVLDLIREYHMIIAIVDVIYSFVLIQISPDQQENASFSELDQLSAEPIRQLAAAASQGIISPTAVVSQLETEIPSSRPYMFFYFRALWQGDLPEEVKAEANLSAKAPTSRRSRFGASTAEILTRSLVSPHADLVVSLFAEYSQTLLNEFLKSSQDYNLSHAAEECRKHHHIPELVHLLSVTGQTSEALHLIIDELDDVGLAVSFAKDVDEQSLWDDLVEYSMDKPKFIRGLLEEASGNVDPVALVQRLPKGQVIPELKESLTKVLKEREATWSITNTASSVLSGEVAEVLKALRRERERGFAFEANSDSLMDPATKENHGLPKTGMCASCHTPFSALAFAPYGSESQEHLIGFRCGHLFHLTCLLDDLKSNSNKAAVDALQIELAADMNDHSLVHGEPGRVGDKMRHAQMIQRALGELHCPSCSEDLHTTDESDDS